MSVALKIKDESSQGELLNEQVLHFPVEDITVRELIEQRVMQEVERYNKDHSKPFLGLIQPRDEEKRLNSPKGKRTRSVDAEAQTKIALDAFGSNGFFLLFNDSQLIDLEQTIRITPNSDVVFLKLVPLVGG